MVSRMQAVIDCNTAKAGCHSKADVTSAKWRNSRDSLLPLLCSRTAADRLADKSCDLTILEPELGCWRLNCLDNGKSQSSNKRCALLVSYTSLQLI